MNTNVIGKIGIIIGLLASLFIIYVGIHDKNISSIIGFAMLGIFLFCIFSGKSDKR